MGRVGETLLEVPTDYGQQVRKYTVDSAVKAEVHENKIFMFQDGKGWRSGEGEHSSN